MAAFTQGLLKHGPLLRAAHGNLHHNAGIGDDFLSLNGNLLGQLSCWRDDDGLDIACRGALVAAWLLAESGVLLDDSLDNGNEEAEGFTGAGFRLRNA